MNPRIADRVKWLPRLEMVGCYPLRMNHLLDPFTAKMSGDCNLRSKHLLCLSMPSISSLSSERVLHYGRTNLGLVTLQPACFDISKYQCHTM